jgi:dCMP deaminase
VGAVLVRDARIIATGYNGAPKGMEHCTRAGCLREAGNVPSGERHELCRGVHAEENCVVQAAVFGVSTVGAELYVTCHPCSLCARTLINAGIRRVCYGGDYPDPLAARLFAEAGIEVVRFDR